MIVRKNPPSGRRLKKDALKMFPALQALGPFKVKADKRFTQEATGLGDIEYFGEGQDRITYPTGKSFRHPARGRKPAVLVNPQTNTAQNVALDLLHGLSDADPKFGGMLDNFAQALGEADVRHFYEQDLKDGYAMDGYDQYRQNYIDGKLRNLLFEGNEEDFRKARYNPTERRDMREYNPQAYNTFLKIQNYLTQDQ